MGQSQSATRLIEVERAFVECRELNTCTEEAVSTTCMEEEVRTHSGYDRRTFEPAGEGRRESPS